MNLGPFGSLGSLTAIAANIATIVKYFALLITGLAPVFLVFEFISHSHEIYITLIGYTDSVRSIVSNIGSLPSMSLVAPYYSRINVIFPLNEGVVMLVALLSLNVAALLVRLVRWCLPF